MSIGLSKLTNMETWEGGTGDEGGNVMGGKRKQGVREKYVGRGKREGKESLMGELEAREKYEGGGETWGTQKTFLVSVNKSCTLDKILVTDKILQVYLATCGQQ